MTIPILGLAILLADPVAYLVAVIFLAPFWVLWWRVVHWQRPRGQLRQFDPGRRLFNGPEQPWRALESKRVRSTQDLARRPGVL